jgi:uncharacterized membrane protein (UPF0127 family)
MSRFVAIALLLLACESNAQAPKKVVASSSDVTAQDYVGPTLPKARVTLVDAFGFKHAVDSEVAATRDSRTRGLMWRTQLAEGVGMLFIFPVEEELNFWMKNTLIPLDMIFISKERVIVGISERAEPKTLNPRGPGNGKPAMYVLEVPGGWASKVGLRPGLKVQLDGVGAIVATD